ncbi:hypothetical protein [Borrelia hermsii]|nr:hypothetical protein [Borrelia hermsii]
MMRYRDGIIGDYELIWEGRFREIGTPNKYKFNCASKEAYGENI